MPTELDASPPTARMYFDALWSDADWFWRSAYFSPYVVRFDAPFIRCWMMRTLCSFIARMCFVSDLASFDADHVSCYPSTGYKCYLFRCFLRRMLTLLDLLLYCRLYVLFLMLTNPSDADRIGCFAHSFRLYVLCFIVLPIFYMELEYTLYPSRRVADVSRSWRWCHTSQQNR